MGSKLVSELLPQDKGGTKDTAFLVTRMCRLHLPFYLSIGMSADEFFNQDVELTVAYRKANEYSMKRRNQEMHMMGRYIYEALLDVSPAFRAFSKTKPLEYRKEPYQLVFEDDTKEKKSKERLEYEKNIKKMDSFMLAFNRNFKSKGGK